MADQELIELLQTLVGIPSVNPDHRGRPEVKGEKAMGDYFRRYMESRGFHVTTEDVKPGRPNVLATYGVEDARKVILIEGHLDTVSVESMSIDPFAAEVRDGRLHGRGACDMKGSFAAAMHALHPSVLAELRGKGWGVAFLAAMGEETGNEGAFHFAAKGGIRADCALVLEPTRLELVAAHKTCTWFTLDLKGRGAHGSNPGAGINAIYPVVGLLEESKKIAAEFARWVPHPLLGKPSINPGKISGGSAVNIVPPSATLEIDLRLLPGMDDKPLRARYASILDAAVAARQLESYEIKTRTTVAFENTPGSMLSLLLSRACARNGADGKLTGSPWFSDASPLSSFCRDVLVFGPGDIAQAHTNDEFIDLEELQKGCEILKSLFEMLPVEADPG